MDRVHLLLVLLPIVQRHESIKAILPRLDLVLSLLPALNLVRPCRLIPEVKLHWASHFVSLDEQVAIVDVGVGLLCHIDRVTAADPVLDISGPFPLGEGALGRGLLLLDSVVSADGHVQNDVLLVADKVKALLDRRDWVQAIDHATIHEVSPLEMSWWEHCRNGA